MATANENIRDAVIRHQVYLQRLTTQQVRDLVTMLDSDATAMTRWLGDRIAPISTMRRMSKQERAALNKLIADYAKKRGIRFERMVKQYEDEVRKLVAHEIDYNVGLLKATVPVSMAFKAPAVEVFADRVIQYGTFAGKTFSVMFEDMAGAETGRVLQAIQTGLAQGEGIPDIVRRVYGTRAADYADGIMQTTRNAVTGVVRTIDNAIANQVRQETMRQNRDLVQEEMFVAVLDGRTTLTCASLDGKLFPIGEGPVPPLHFNCRSTRVPIVDAGWVSQVAGERPYVRDTRTRRMREMDFQANARRQIGEGQWKKLTAGERRAEVSAVRARWAEANIGQVPANLTFSQWFERQPRSFQKEYLGESRFRMYDAGKLTLSQFVDTRGHTLTLKQLIAKDKSLLNTLD